jgi:adenosine/AMP kinase
MFGFSQVSSTISQHLWVSSTFSDSNKGQSVLFIRQEGVMPFEIKVVPINKPEPINFILGQSHFIKTVEDLHEALVNAVPGIKFGIAFCEASGKALVRWSGNDEAMIKLAQQNAKELRAGHSFIIFLAEGFYPVNVLNSIKLVPEVVHVFCATANPVQVIVAETEMGRGILGVIDGVKTKGIEGEEDIAWRKGFLRTIGYKL